MEVFGNVDALKESIQKRYSSEIKEIEKDNKKRLDIINRDLKGKLGILSSRTKAISKAEMDKAHSMILSEEKLKAKKEFEEKRESLIGEVFEEAKKKAKDIVHSSRYVNFVRKSMQQKKGFSVIGDSDYYKDFFPELEVDDSIIGLKFMSKSVSYDFTLNNIIASKKDALRQEVSRILFS
ncbi:V-type ATP synthase subunit E [Candidatus Woesearchaeota archaeon]|nr:V-type ATP synthase subunit E [Candidatus Woesearchaeota archaeon]